MAYSLTWLPQVLRSAGLKVATEFGWENRGRGEMGEILGVICHHTGDTRNGNMPSLATLIRGRSDLPGPLAQLGLGRDGTFYVLAAGRCNHAGKGNWKGVTKGNFHFIGIEAENKGTAADKWPEAQLDAYRRGVAAILKHIGRGADDCVGHKEWARDRKPPLEIKHDPTFDMNQFRASVSLILNGSAPPPPLIPRAEPPKTPGGAPGRPTLRRGMDDARVLDVQAKLGIIPGNPHFGPKTEAAVRAFQRAHGLLADGIVGPRTWALLDEVVEAPPPAAPEGDQLAWGAKVSEEFRDRVRAISKSIGCDPNDLMACMAFESGGTFSPSIRNKASGATGLIQFMPATAASLGTTTDKLAALTAEKQLDYVERYFRWFPGVRTLEDVYMAILWPRAIGRPNDYVLFAAPSKEYKQNSGLDKDGDGKVTKFEAAAAVRARLKDGLLPANLG